MARSLFSSIVIAATALGAVSRAGEPVPEVILASGGRARMPVVVGAGAGERAREAAADLADLLGRISGAAFTVVTGDGATGIAAGTPADFPGVAAPEALAVPGPTQREDYMIESHPAGVRLLGATELAVEHAVWDFLYRLGYRQFFPGAPWEAMGGAVFDYHQRGIDGESRTFKASDGSIQIRSHEEAIVGSFDVTLVGPDEEHSSLSGPFRARCSNDFLGD